MKQSYVWLLALLSILTLAATSTLAIAEEDSAHLSGKVEIGVTSVDTKDDPARVNEYSKYRRHDGTNFAPSLDLEYRSPKGFEVSVESVTRGPRDQHHALELDAYRIFRLDMDYQVFEHWKDHDNLESQGATFTGDTYGDQPRVTTDLTAGQIPANPAVNGLEVLEAAQVNYYQELDNNYVVERREFESEADLTIPAFPNVTFHVGYRLEERDGYEQAITSSKCSQCHVQANSKEIDESTEDITLGATGKFGMLTVEYEYLSRDFDADGDNASYNYLKAGKKRAGVYDYDQLLYWGMEEYKDTPDSEKQSHVVKARLDLPKNTTISANYVNSDIESDKDGEEGTYSLNKGTLSSDLESLFFKGVTRFGALRLSIRGGTYDLDGPDYYAYFPDRDDNTSDPMQDFDNPQHYESAESREVTEFGIDAVYRLARATTLRLGYDYEDVDRDVGEFGDTETNTYKIAVQSRLNKQFSGRISYEYQDIDDPFHGEEMTGIAQGIGDTDEMYPGMEWLYTDDFRRTDGNPPSGAVYYWNSAYPSRTLDTSTDPDEVQEVKSSVTWAPTSTMALTASGRYRYEEYDDVDYKQRTYSPGLSFYYAPTGNLSLTMAYTYNKQKTENQMCVGWYHG